MRALAVEAKSWVDPNMPGGACIIARITIALRNDNEGYPLIGIDDDTLQSNSLTLLKLLPVE